MNVTWLEGTGARISDVLKWEWTDVDENRARIRVRKPRMVA